jgi:hypothetical protein
MHRTITVLAVALAFSIPSFAQPKAPAKKAAEPAAAPASSSASSSGRGMNIYVAPLGLIFGSANVAGEFKASDSFSIGPTLSYAGYSSTVGTTKTTASAFGFGVAASLYTGGMAFEDGWVLTPAFTYVLASNGSNKASAIGISAEYGYGWYWDSGFNMGLGFGIQYVGLDFAALGFATSLSAVLPSLKFSMGYAF